MCKNYSFLLALAFFCNFSYSQIFEEIGEPSFQGVFYGDCTVFDLNNDNRKDLLLSGAVTNYTTGHTSVYKSTVNGLEKLEETFSQIMYSAITTGDLDGNGFADIAITGVRKEANIAQSNVFEIYYNNGDNTFTKDSETGILPVTYGSVEIADFNNDGIKDLLVNGSNSSSYISKIYFQDANNNFTDSNIALMGTYFSDTKVFDANDDGFLDILITGFNTSYTPDSILYINQQNGTFVQQESGLPGVYFSSIDVADINADGIPDLLLSGMRALNDTMVPILTIYQNNGLGVFTATTNEFIGTYGGTSTFVDYNNDGLLDVFSIGSNAANENKILLYKNNGDETFEEDTENSSTLTGLNMSRAVWFDYDNDTDLDLLTMGFAGNVGVTKFYKNTLFNEETPCNQDPGPNTGDTGCVTFIYNGVQTTYTTVRSADGNIWVQQNLGSDAVATSGTDANAYGDLFQWGRWDDGHQLRNSQSSSTAVSPNNPLGLGTGDNKFYYTDPEWWDGGLVTDTWKAQTPANVTADKGCDPCKALGQGWRLPTQADWTAAIAAENITNIATAFGSNLKLTVAGNRGNSLSNVGVRGYYWSSTVSPDNAGFSKYFFYSNLTINPNAGGLREQGSSVRCLKDALDYCAVSVENDVEPISLVSIGDIHNETSAVVGASPAYEDFTAISTDLEKGETYNLAVKGNTVGQYEHDIRVFFDWNQDKVFDMETEYYFVSLSPSTGTDNVTASIDIVIPTNAALGTTRMRIIKDQWNIYEEGEFDACLDAYYGQIEDYTVNIIGAIIDNPITAVTVTTGNNANAEITTEAGTLQLIATATPVEANQNVNWSIASGATFATVDTNGLVTAIQNGTVTVKATSVENSSIFGQLTLEISNQPLAFCVPEFEEGTEAITLVEFADISNSSSVATSTPEYEDFSSIIGNVVQGFTYNLMVKGSTEGASFTNYIYAYFDWDNSRTFEDEEGIYIGSIQNSNGNDNASAQLEIEIPQDAALGKIRMRVLKKYSSTALTTIPACNLDSYGQAEDYTLNIQDELGTGDFSKNNLKLYPNPTTDFVNVQTDSEIKSIHIYNSLGQLIATQKESKINLSNKTTGIYMIHVVLENGTAVTQKIIKK